MKYYFIVNPVAGTGKEVDNFVGEVHTTLSKQELPYEIITTEKKKGALSIARRIAEELNGEEAWIFACGGDGTINEVVNGVYGFENIAVGAVPLGTGNDLVRNFPEAGNFRRVRSQINGKVQPIDLIRYKGFVDGEETTQYCVNMINIGFDCNVVETTNRLKQKPLIAGSFAYLLAVFGNFVKKKGISLRITEYGKNSLDSVVSRDGEMLLCAVCNGSYCGGGIKSAPMSIVDDGEFELNIINDVSRMRFLELFPKFKQGEHMEIPGIEKEIEVRPCKDVRLESYDKYQFFICVDGEIKETTGIRVTIVEKGLNFIVPGQ